MNKLNIICEINFGSTLYGTRTKNSDTDIKGIFMPTMEQIFLGKIPKNMTEKTNKTNNKNTSEDIEKDYHSLHHFIHLACTGQTVAIDMLNCNKENLLKTSDIWEDLVENRHRFYSKNMKAFIGYARSQAARYGVKGDRISTAKRLKRLFDKHRSNINIKENDLRVGDIWEEIKDLNLPHVHFKESQNKINNVPIKELVVCGKTIQETCTMLYATSILFNFLNKYGKRAKLAEENKGIDWKAVSHSLRIAMELKEIFETYKITFPLKYADWLIKVKKGELDYKTLVAPVLDELMEEIEILSEKSDLPNKINVKYWNDWLYCQIYNDINEEMFPY